MDALTLSQALELTPGYNNRFIINVKLIAKASDNSFTISDKTAEARLMVKQLKPQYERYLQLGRVVRLIDPSIDKNIKSVTITTSTSVCLGKPIEGLEISTDVLLQDLSICANLDPHTDVPGVLFLKVVKIHRAKKVTGPWGETSVQEISMKDIKGSKTIISIWESHPFFTKIEDGKVYLIENLKTEKYPKKKPHNLTTKKNTNFNLADPSIEIRFHDIKWQDNIFEGRIVAFNDFNAFSSCLKCKCSLKSQEIGSKCPRCTSYIEDKFDD